MSKKVPICGVLLFEDAHKELEQALKPYIKTGPIGKYIYCNKAVQDGHFLTMTISPGTASNAVGDEMQISVPIRFVKFIASASRQSDLGFEV